MVHVRVRRFRCMRKRCTTKMFCERLGELAEPYARRTRRLNRNLMRIAMATGGRAGSRLAEVLGVSVGRMTLLRLVRREPCPVGATPTVLGVDDFALRRGHNYGTILYDIERHEVVDLLPDRTAEGLADWLRYHPGVKILSRDRAEAYAQGGQDGAPGTQQVADRWHLLSNLGDALKRFLSQHHAALQKAACPDEASADAPDEQTLKPAEPARRPAAQIQVDAHRQARLARYEKIHRLKSEGHSVKDIAAHMGMGEAAVRRFLRAPQFPERAERAAAPGKLDPFHSLVLERWDAGDRDVKKLLEVLRGLGYTGSRSRLYDFIQTLRHMGRPSRKLAVGAGKFSPRELVSMILIPARTLEEQSALDSLSGTSALFAMARDLAQRFCWLIRKSPREDAQGPLEVWLAEALSCPIASLASFARGLRDDWEAVVAGLSLSWSNGPVEGTINKLKMIKRQMFGRANFDLL